MTRWSNDDHQADELTSRPADETAERLRRLARETKEAELERRIQKKAARE
jgi:hypothetical protein